MKSVMRVEKRGYLMHIKVKEQTHKHEGTRSRATAVISVVPTEHPLSLSLSVACTATVKQVEQNDALQ